MALPQRSPGCRTTLEQRDRTLRPTGAGSLKAPRPPAVAFFSRRRRPRSSRPFPGLRRLVSDAGQRLLISIAGSSSIRRLKDVAIVMDLHELAPVGGRATSGRDGRRLEWFAEVCQGLTSRGRSHPGLLPLANLRFEVSRLLPAVHPQPDVAAAVRGTRAETPPPAESVSPKQSVTCRASVA